MIKDVLQDWQKEAKLSTLYTSIIRPVLEYASIGLIWNPWLRKDISALDSVQRKCEKIVQWEDILWASVYEEKSIWLDWNIQVH